MGILLFGCLWLATSGSVQAQREQSGHPLDGAQRHWEHLEYLIRLKNDIARASWPDYAREDVTLPTLYYTFNGTFVINPNPHILQLANPTPVPSPDPDWKIYRLPESYTDTLEFQFSNSYSDDPTDLYYRENIMIFSSFELTQRFVPITDLQEWAEMVLHELFHSYQRSIPGFREYYSNLPIPGGPDAFLGGYHKELDWYREAVAQENQLLKDVWQGTMDPREGIRKYLDLREVRRKRILEKYGVDISEIEDYEILIEGHARYFQSLAKRYMRDHPTDTSMLREADRDRIGNIFAGYEPHEDTGLSDIYNDRYYYQLGYNIAMILEKYLPGYAESIYHTVFNYNPYLEALAGDGPTGEKE
ncbi:MAG: hypothetical protein R3252_11895 [Robiginitalea sp.]|nr:hypothetical protein [Robiginitalea sp.]